MIEGILVVAVLSWTVPAVAVDHAAATCSAADVQAKIDLAADGDRVLIPAGDCTWSTHVTIPNTKGIKLKGAGQGVTIIRHNVTSFVSGYMGGMLSVWVAPSNSVVEISDFTIEGNGKSSAKIAFQGAGLDRYRVHHVSLNNNAGTGMFQMPDMDGTNELSGLWDHMTCYGLAGAHCIQMQGQHVSSGQGQFTRPIQFGTNHMTYIEDSTISYLESPADGGADNYSGARVVARYNTVINTELTGAGHGADSALRGVHSYETYRNALTMNYPPGWAVTNQRSGVGIEFDNTATGTYSNFNYTIYRRPGVQPDSWWTLHGGDCDGTNPWDGNIGGAGRPAGYPCLDQQGWFFGQGPNGTKTLTPQYFFRNKINGVLVDPQGGTGVEMTAGYIQKNVEFYSDVDASCSGASCSTGVGIGPLASRPPNCAPGVGYWATDQGTWNKAAGTPGGQGQLYKCTAPNTWSLYYTPYTYPHPLQATSNASPPPPPPPPSGSYSLTPAPLTAVVGSTITLTWSAPSSHSTQDWIGMYAPSSTNAFYIQWYYVPAGSTGQMTFNPPAAGTYEFRYLPNNGYVDVARSPLVTIQAAGSGAVYDINGDGSVTVADVQRAVNQALGIESCGAGDVNKDGTCNVADVQPTVNAVLGL